MGQLKVDQEVLASAARTTNTNTRPFPVQSAKELFFTFSITVLSGTLKLFFDTCGDDGAWIEFANSGNITAIGPKKYSFASGEFSKFVRVRWTIGTTFTASARVAITEQH